MRISKRLSALALAMCMLITLGFSAMAVTFTDVPDTSPYKDAITSLTSLNLLKGYEDGTFGPDKTITRAEFSAVITRALGLEEVAANASSKAIFTDMLNSAGAEHWGSGYVKIAYDLQIVSGYGDGTFGPDNEVTYEQVVKMIVCTLGYGAAAEAKGGWPQGYLAQGSEIGVTKGAVLAATNGSAPRGLVAKLLYNSLEIKLMELSKDKYIITNKTLLSDKLKMIKLDNAMVVDVEGNSIDEGTSTLRQGQLKLEESNKTVEIYKFANVLTAPAANALLGHYVNGFYKIDTTLDERVLISIDTNSTKNTTTTVDSSNIESYTTSRTLSYWINKDTDSNPKTVDIASDAKLIYNGKAFDYAKTGDAAKANLTYWLSPNSPAFIYGDVTLLDSGANGDINVVFLNHYETFVSKETIKTTDSVYDNNYWIYDFYGGIDNIRLDVEDRDLDITILNAATKQPMNIANIAPYNVVSIAKSFDGKKYVVYVSTASISGKVSEMARDYSYYTINNKRYELAPSFKRAIYELSKENIEIDTSGTFYLDKNGKIAAAKVTAVSAGNYAYITAGSTGVGVASEPVLKLFIPGQSAPVIYPLAAKVRVSQILENGKQTATSFTSELAMKEIKDSAAKLKSNIDVPDDEVVLRGTEFTQPIKYTLSSNKIDSVTLLQCIEEEYTENGEEKTRLIPQIGENANSGILKLGTEMKTLKYTSSNNFENQVYITSSTVVLVVPDDRTADTVYKKVTPSTFFTIGQNYRIEAWDTTTSSAKLLVVYGQSAGKKVTFDTPPSIVTGVSQKMSTLEQGTQIVSLQVIENGVNKTYETENTNPVYTDIKIGDIIRFGFNGTGQINEVKYAQKFDSIAAKSEHSVETYDVGWKYNMMTGTVYNYTDANIIVAEAMVVLDGEGKPTLDISNIQGFAVNASVNIYRIERNGSTVTVTKAASINDLTAFGNDARATASKVFVYAHNNILKTIVWYVN